jgi:hypothetical protein
MTTIAMTTTGRPPPTSYSHPGPLRRWQSLEQRAGLHRFALATGTKEERCPRRNQTENR